MTSTMGWAPLTLKAGSTELSAFERNGPEDRAPVVLLHGAGGNALTWTTITPAFTGRRVLLLDMPGHGLSPKPSRWDLDDTADRVARAVQGWLGDAHAIWGGHSWGGKVAGMVAAASPSRCRGLLLFDPSPSASLPVDVEEFVDGTWGVEMQPYASPESAAEAARAQRHWQPWDDETAAAFRHGLAQHEDGSWSLRPTREDLVALATATLHLDATEMLAKAAALPVLLLIAEESTAWQGVTNMLVYPTAARMVIAGNHWIHQCNRMAVIGAVKEWLSRIAA